MRMISCISPVTSGTLRVLGMDPASDGPRIRSRMGLVPQEDSLDLELTVLDNLMIYGRYFDMPKKVIRERADQLLDFAQLTERAHDRVDPLSGGMKRRLTIARALISDPDLLILDEPTTGLDPQARHLLWDRLYRLKQDGVTLIITTHYMDEAEQLCDRLVVMDKGRFAAEGTPRQLIDAYSTKEVVELRFAPGEHEEIAPSLAALAERQEILPDRILLYTDDGDAALAEVARMGHVARSTLVRRSTLEDVFLRLTGRSLGGLISAWPPRCKGRRRRPVLFRHGETVSARRIPTPMWLRAAGYWGYQYRRTWRSSVITSFLIPVLYLAAMGIALGSLIDKHSHGVDGVTYVAYLAPGLLAGTCMQIGTNDATYPVMGAIKWMRTYLAQLATPLEVYDVLLGHLAWIAARLAIVVSIYLAVMAAFGVVYSPWAIAAFPAAVLTGLAFAAPVSAFAATQDKDSSFSTLYRFAIIPMFLFSGTFFPISQLPALAPGRRLRDAALSRRRSLPGPDTGIGLMGGPRTRRVPVRVCRDRIHGRTTDLFAPVDRVRRR